MPDGDMQFATRLYGALATRPGNLFFAPASIRLALGMTYAGARGQTADEMRKVLGMPEGDAAHQGYAALLDRWASFASPKLPDAATQRSDPSMQRYWEDELKRRTVELHVVNRLFTQRGKQLRADYLALLQRSYRAQAVPLDFATAPQSSRLEINRWVSEQTKKKIQELIPEPGVTSATRSVLVNAIYFKAMWANPFEPSSTKADAFFVSAGKKVTAPLMHATEHYSLGDFDGGAILELPYGNRTMVMDVILPKAKDGLHALEQRLAEGALPRWLATLQPQRVEVALPRWKTSAAFELADKLKGLGMPLPFTFPGADFSGIDDTKLLYLSAVVHQAVVEVDERGTEAAAATAVMMAAGGVPSKPASFRADHPFVYLIRDTASGTILFLGRVVDPTSR